MIIDHLKNIGLYKKISPELSIGLDFIAAAKEGLAIGTHQVQDGVKAIVSEYQTKPLEASRYETHKKAIDIQYLLKGEELIRWLAAQELSPITEYDIEKDIRFYSARNKGIDLILNQGLFVVFFPEDGHCPGLYADNGPEPVKKLVIKVRTT